MEQTPAFPKKESTNSTAATVLVVAAALGVFFLFWGTVLAGTAGYFLWRHYDYEARLTQAREAYADQFDAQVTALNQQLSSSEITISQLKASLDQASRATRSLSIVTAAYESDTELLRRDTSSWEADLAQLDNLQTALKKEYRIRSGDALATASQNGERRSLHHQVRLVEAGLQGIGTQLTAVSARRAQLDAREQQEAERLAAAARQQTVVRTVYRPAPVVSPFITWDRPYYYRPGYAGYYGYRGYGYRDYNCGPGYYGYPRSGVGVSFVFR